MRTRRGQWHDAARPHRGIGRRPGRDADFRAWLGGECVWANTLVDRIVSAPINHPDTRIGIESSDGRTRTLDERADGTGYGEGSGAVVLKRLDCALADGDRVYAVIKGSALNHDGVAGGMTI